MRVLLTGAGGQVGRAILKLAPANASVIGLGRAELDIADDVSVGMQISALRPDIIVNAAAYTAVDRAEAEPEAAHRTNARAPGVLAMAAADCGAKLIQISTDFVFDGSASRPYPPDATPAPLSVYGRTKLEGEHAVRSILGDQSLILRTAWVYDGQGRNFLRTMLRIMAEQESVGVVADQVGSPTAAHSVAEAVWSLVSKAPQGGVFHWTDAGVASWYDFAVAIAEEASARGLLRSAVRVTPIATDEYPTLARRPAYSVLDKRATARILALEQIHWRQRLRMVLREG